MSVVGDSPDFSCFRVGIVPRGNIKDILVLYRERISTKDKGRKRSAVSFISLGCPFSVSTAGISTARDERYQITNQKQEKSGLEAIDAN
jgi:hypothetical protein